MISLELSDKKVTVPNKVEKERLDYLGMISKKMKQIFRKIKSMESEQEKLILSIHRQLHAVELVHSDLTDKISFFEESLLLIMHNIKKNQFLYSHYPDEWAKDYLAVRKGIEEENSFLDKRKIS